MSRLCLVDLHIVEHDFADRVRIQSGRSRTRVRINTVTNPYRFIRVPILYRSSMMYRYAVSNFFFLSYVYIWKLECSWTRLNHIFVSEAWVHGSKFSTVKNLHWFVVFFTKLNSCFLIGYPVLRLILSKNRFCPNPTLLVPGPFVHST